MGKSRKTPRRSNANRKRMAILDDLFAQREVDCLQLTYLRALTNDLFKVIRHLSPPVAGRIAALARQYTASVEVALDNPQVGKVALPKLLTQLERDIDAAVRGRGRHKPLPALSDEALEELDLILKRAIKDGRKREAVRDSAKYILEIFGLPSPFGPAHVRAKRLRELAAGPVDDRWRSLIEGAAAYVGLPSPSGTSIAEMIAACRKGGPAEASLIILAGLSGLSLERIRNRLTALHRP